ncbi:F-box only protein 28-like [Limulus polyphemus]|uniref:F-box only protein 28-like n=1 Tax=Limulus polyphemus TaxID=6850 RepID=A0ABM1BKU5_LIMPO|nr:F-box only protein 28-like [Limulus polyphemus]
MDAEFDNDDVHILKLPTELLEKILTFLSYDEICHRRLVCKKFNRCCQHVLNVGFIQVEKFHARCLRNVKAQLPRRESERRNHPLARHCDILTAVETRLSLLSMTFMKYVEMGLCCFIPGKVIDEIYGVLRYIQTTKCPPRAHEILQELRDISSMAMEHFDENIAPILKMKIGASGSNISSQNCISLTGPPTHFPSTSRHYVKNIGVKQELAKINMTVKQLSSTNVTLRKELIDYKAKIAEQTKKLQEQEKHLLDQSQIIAEQGARIMEQEGKIGEVNKKLLEYDRHFADIMAELTRVQDPLRASGSSQQDAHVYNQTTDSSSDQNKMLLDKSYDSVSVNQNPDHESSDASNTFICNSSCTRRESTVKKRGFPYPEDEPNQRNKTLKLRFRKKK